MAKDRTHWLKCDLETQGLSDHHSHDDSDDDFALIGLKSACYLAAREGNLQLQSGI